MCNACNHPPGCNCGWGGGYFGGGGRTSTTSAKIAKANRKANSTIADRKAKANMTLADKFFAEKIAKGIQGAKTYPTKCWWCGEKVFYHTNGFGDSVLFDSLGSPWRVHSCWKDYWNEERLRTNKNYFNSVENSVIIHTRDGKQFITRDGKQFKCLLLAGAIQSINENQKGVREEEVASRLGISLEELRKSFSHLYYYSRSRGNSRLIRMRFS